MEELITTLRCQALCCPCCPSRCSGVARETI